MYNFSIFLSKLTKKLQKGKKIWYMPRLIILINKKYNFSLWERSKLKAHGKSNNITLWLISKTIPDLGLFNLTQHNFLLLHRWILVYKNSNTCERETKVYNLTIWSSSFGEVSINCVSLAWRGRQSCLCLVRNTSSKSLRGLHSCNPYTYHTSNTRQKFQASMASSPRCLSVGSLLIPMVGKDIDTASLRSLASVYPASTKNIVCILRGHDPCCYMFYSDSCTSFKSMHFNLSTCMRNNMWLLRCTFEIKRCKN